MYVSSMVNGDSRAEDQRQEMLLVTCQLLVDAVQAR